jgi:hypothetical protein
MESIDSMVDEVATTDEVPAKKLLPAQCKSHYHDRVVAAFEDMVTGFIEQAKKGSTAHMKMALEIVSGGLGTDQEQDETLALIARIDRELAALED